MTHPFYETPEKGSHDEKENIKPLGVRGVWWHETLRVLANIEKSVPVLSFQGFGLTSLVCIYYSLNLAILRVGLVYGPYVEYGVCELNLSIPRELWLRNISAFYHDRRFGVRVLEEANESLVSDQARYS